MASIDPTIPVTAAQLQGYRDGWHASQNAHKTGRDLEAALHRFNGDIDSFELGWMDVAADAEWGSALPIWRVVGLAQSGVWVVQGRKLIAKTFSEIEASLPRFKKNGFEVKPYREEV